jgi:hypothetical protein
MHTSEILRDILTKNPGVQTFSIERILASIGHEHLEASMMMFSIPAIVPVPVPTGTVALPTSALAYQLVSGKKSIRFPDFILRKTVSRKSLAVAIHAVLPILEAAEKIVRPRWSWATHPISRRAIGLLVFLLAVAIAYPFFGFNALHALSLFVISLGMAEGDGLAIVVGIVAGVLSLAILVASGVSVRTMQMKAGKSVRKFARKLGLNVFASFLERHGHPQLAKLITFKWTKVLMTWDPERRAAERGTTTTTRPTPHYLASRELHERQLLRLDAGREPIQVSRLPRVDEGRAEVREQTRVQTSEASEDRAGSAERVHGIDDAVVLLETLGVRTTELDQFC